MDEIKLYIIAGEPSGDVLGGKLICALKSLDPHIIFKGVGGDNIAKQGVVSLFPIKDIAVMGFSEVLPHVRTVFKRIDQTVDDIIDFKPDAVITIDSPGFCKRVVKKLKQRGYQGKLIHYVAPTVWAYKPKRAEKFAELFDHIMVLLPFEVPYFEKVGLDCTFVGHSIVEEQVAAGQADRFREKYNIDHDAVILSVLCGSRQGEIKRLFDIFSQTIQFLSQKIPKLHVVFPTISDMEDTLKQKASGLGTPYTVISDPMIKFDAYAASYFALCKSGTISLELSLAGVPMIVAYKVSPLSAWLLRRMIQVDYVNLINILANDEVIPECLQEQCTSDILANRLWELFSDKEVCNQQKSKTQEMLKLLNVDEERKPSEVAAETIMHIVN